MMKRKNHNKGEGGLKMNKKGMMFWQLALILLSLLISALITTAIVIGVGGWIWNAVAGSDYEPPVDVNESGLMSECVEISNELTERELGSADICSACSLKTLFRAGDRACYWIEDGVDNCIDSLQATVEFNNCEIILTNHFLNGFVTYRIEGAELELSAPSGGIIGHVSNGEIVAQPCEESINCIIVELPEECIESEPEEPVEPSPPVYSPYGVGLVPVCGNGQVETGEECDDGGSCSDNNEICTTIDLINCGEGATCIPQNGDGCSAVCLEENAGGPITLELELPEEIMCNESIINITELFNGSDNYLEDGLVLQLPGDTNLAQMYRHWALGTGEVGGWYNTRISTCAHAGGRWIERYDKWGCYGRTLSTMPDVCGPGGYSQTAEASALCLGVSGTIWECNQHTIGCHYRLETYVGIDTEAEDQHLDTEGNPIE